MIRIQRTLNKECSRGFRISIIFKRSERFIAQYVRKVCMKCNLSAIKYLRYHFKCTEKWKNFVQAQSTNNRTCLQEKLINFSFVLFIFRSVKNISPNKSFDRRISCKLITPTISLSADPREFAPSFQNFECTFEVLTEAIYKKKKAQTHSCGMWVFVRFRMQYVLIKMPAKSNSYH